MTPAGDNDLVVVELAIAASVFSVGVVVVD